ncbi:MAG: PEP-CTERM sorting domain-containing protein [Pirellulales bacterium]|nr:PEP-CTERM sorting domain-containing protein [Pirellulales bacterium]
MNRFCVVGAICLGLLALVLNQAAASVIANGSFENTTASGPFQVPNLWSFTGNLAVTTGQGETDGNKALAFSFANLPSNADLWQTFSTTPTTRYALTFDFGKYAISQPLQVARLEVEVFDGAGFAGSRLLHKFAIDSTPGIGDPNSTDSPSVYSPFLYAFFATGSSATLRFRDLSDPQVGGGGFDAMLDNVNIVATPEPSTFVLAGIGLASLSWVARRRPSQRTRRCD